MTIRLHQTTEGYQSLLSSQTTEDRYKFTDNAAWIHDCPSCVNTSANLSIFPLAIHFPSENIPNLAYDISWPKQRRSNKLPAYNKVYWPQPNHAMGWLDRTERTGGTSLLGDKNNSSALCLKMEQVYTVSTVYRAAKGGIGSNWWLEYFQWTSSGWIWNTPGQIISTTHEKHNFCFFGKSQL